MCVPPAFGPGSRAATSPKYFSGESSMRVQSIGEIVSWLQTCEYAADLDLFQKKDHWQHPGTFEERRRGDAKDFALWALAEADRGSASGQYVGRVVCEIHPGAIAITALGGVSH